MAIYAITLESQSRYRPIFSVFLPVGFVYTFLFGWSFAQASTPSDGTVQGTWAAAIGVTLFVVHLIERVRRHLAADEQFMEFR